MKIKLFNEIGNIKDYLLKGVILICLIITSISIYRCTKVSKELNQKENLIEQIGAKPKPIDGGLETTVIEQDIDKVLDLKTEDPRIKELQQELTKVKKELKDKGSLTLSKNEIKYDTFFIKQKDTLAKYSTIDTIKNKDIYTVFGRKNDTVIYSLELNNVQKTIISEKKEKLFGPRILTVQVTNSNPYLKVTDIVSFQTYKPKPSKFGLGVHAGYGVTGQLKTTPVISLGFNYNFINF